MQRHCMQFYCDARGERMCCADCYLRRDCANPCRNDPVRCRLEDKAWAPNKRRTGTGKLLPKKRKQ